MNDAKCNFSFEIYWIMKNFAFGLIYLRKLFWLMMIPNIFHFFCHHEHFESKFNAICTHKRIDSILNQWVWGDWSNGLYAGKSKSISICTYWLKIEICCVCILEVFSIRVINLDVCIKFKLYFKWRHIWSIKSIRSQWNTFRLAVA